MSIALAEPFIRSSTLFCDFAAHLLLISAMRLGVSLEHLGAQVLTDLLRGNPGAILDVVEVIAIAAIVVRSFFRRDPHLLRRKPSKRPRKPAKPALTKKARAQPRRGSKRPCACRKAKRKT